jgi:hypothetical protein
MEACSLCAAPLDGAATTCQRCGFSAVRPRRPGDRWRRLARAARVAVAFSALALAVLSGAAAWSAWRTAGSCEPHSWADWHSAIQRSCLTPAYVCRNMTTAKLLADPEVLADYHRALRTGHREALAYLEALVAHLRAAYGCEGTAPEASPLRDPQLPPGHPPLPAELPIFEPPPALTI